MSADLYLALKLYEAGDAVAAMQKCQSILAVGDGEGEVYLLLAQIFYDQGDHQTSLRYLNEAESSTPTVTTAHTYLVGLNHYACNQLVEAKLAFEAVRLIEPENGDVLRNLGIIAKVQGNKNAAASLFCAALHHSSMDTLTLRNLFDCLGQFDWVKVRGTRLHQDIQHYLEAAFHRSEVDMKKYLPVVAAVVASSEPFRQAIEALELMSSDRNIEIDDQAWLGPLTHDPLLQEFLKSDVIPLVDFEIVLTEIRSGLLVWAVSDNPTLDIPLEFCASLAHQAYLTEYAYFLGRRESELLRELQKGLLAKIDLGQELRHIEAVRLAISASYVSMADWLDEVPSVSVDGRLDDLFQLQFINSREVAELEPQIETLTPVSNQISLKVKKQYEQNPFPRWSILSRPIPYSIGETLQFFFPDYVPSEKLFESSSILIAGCGTGQQPILEALRYPSSKIIAVDLSRSSLAYAMGKAKHHEVQNIRFLQGDILELDQTNDKHRDKYDVIECTGVLHHMADPLVGWRALLSRLAPGGVMKIGLYSEQARRHITEVRHWIQEQELEANAEDIRRARRDILMLSVDDPKRSVTSFSDFFSISGARDLLFHVQECTFTFPKIGSALEELGLKVIGVQMPDDISDKYGAMFPADQDRANLDNLRQFEDQYPDSFCQMYIFWCQKI